MWAERPQYMMNQPLRERQKRTQLNNIFPKIVRPRFENTGSIFVLVIVGSNSRKVRALDLIVFLFKILLSPKTKQKSLDMANLRIPIV